MNAYVFDILKLARRLEAAGFSSQQAEGAAEAIADTLGEHIATKRDLSDLDRSVQAGFKDVRTEFGTLSKDLRSEMAANDKALRADLRDLEQRMTIRLGGMLAAAIALVGAMMKLL